MFVHGRWIKMHNALHCVANEHVLRNRNYFQSFIQFSIIKCRIKSPDLWNPSSSVNVSKLQSWQIFIIQRGELELIFPWLWTWCTNLNAMRHVCSLEFHWLLLISETAFLGLFSPPFVSTGMKCEEKMRVS